MALLSDSREILPIHRKILAFTFVGWIFDFYDLLLLTFVVSSTALVRDLALSGRETGVLLGTALGFTAVGGLIGGGRPGRPRRQPPPVITLPVFRIGTPPPSTPIRLLALAA